MQSFIVHVLVSNGNSVQERNMNCLKTVTEAAKKISARDYKNGSKMR